MSKLLCALLLGVSLLVACGPSAAPQPAVAPAAAGPTGTPVPPVQVPANIPVMEGATDLQVKQSGITYVDKSSMKDAMDYFGKEMPARGWKEQEKAAVISDFGRMYFEDPTHQVSILFNASPTINQVVIRMTLMTLNVVEGTATPKP